MTLLVIGEDLARRSISVVECLEAVEAGFRLLAKGEIAYTYSQVANHDGVASIHLYSAFVPGYGVGAKILHAHEHNPSQGNPYIYATVLMLDTETGEPQAIVNGGYLTALRTAAAAALSTRYLARPDSETLGILGTGLQARTHLRCHLATHPFSKVLVWGRTPERVGEFIEEMARHVEVSIDTAQSADMVVSEADVISCTTRARTPLFSKDAVRIGSHIIVTGAMGSDGSEIPLDLLSQALLFVDSEREFRKHWLHDETPTVEAELGAVIVEQVNGRPDPYALTVFKPIGMAFEDVVSARIVIDHVLKRQAGQIVDW